MFQKAAQSLEINLYGVLLKTTTSSNQGDKWNMGTGFAVNETDILTAVHNLYVDNNPNTIHSFIQVIHNNPDRWKNATCPNSISRYSK